MNSWQRGCHKELWGEDKHYILKFFMHDFLPPQPDQTQLEIGAIISISFLSPVTSKRD